MHAAACRRLADHTVFHSECSCSIDMVLWVGHDCRCAHRWLGIVSFLTEEAQRSGTLQRREAQHLHSSRDPSEQVLGMLR
jgi:hypothetical protein